MTRQAYTSGRHRPRNGSSAGRQENAVDEDRPFAEIRKNLQDVLRMLALHRWAFFVPLSVVASTVFILSLYYPRTFRATSSFERKNDPVIMNLPMSAGVASFNQFRNTLARDLTSMEYMREVVDNLGLTRQYDRAADGTLTKIGQRRRDQLARSLASTLSVTSVSPSSNLDVIEIAYTGPDPALGKRLVDEAKKEYIRRTKAATHTFLTDQRDYFTREAKEALVQLKKARWDETHFRLENPYADPVHPGGISLKLAQREMERRELELRQREYESELSALRQMLAAIVPSEVHRPATVATPKIPPRRTIISAEQRKLLEQIRSVDVDIDELRATQHMTNEHPKVVSLLERRQWLRKQLEQQRQYDQRNVVPDDVEPADPTNATAPSETDFNSTVRSDRARILVQISSQEVKLNDLKISLKTNAQVITQLRKAKGEAYEKQEEFSEIIARVAKIRQKYNQHEKTVATIEPAINAFQKGKLVLFSAGAPARGSSIPVSPKASTVVILALLAGIATGIIFVVLAEVFDHTYRSSSQVARSLGLPMLESIDEIVTSEDRRYLFMRKIVVAPLIVVCFIGLTGLTGSMAYLSIAEPWTYERISRIPQAFLHLFAATSQIFIRSVTLAT